MPGPWLSCSCQNHCPFCTRNLTMSPLGCKHTCCPHVNEKKKKYHQNFLLALFFSQSKSHLDKTGGAYNCVIVGMWCKKLSCAFTLRRLHSQKDCLIIEKLFKWSYTVTNAVINNTVWNLKISNYFRGVLVCQLSRDLFF